MNISVVIPNYNGASLLSKNLPKIIKILDIYTDGKTEIIISDDASKDDSLTVLESFFHRYHGKTTWKILKSAAFKNKGFSSNVNRGVHAATGDVVILLNSDVVPRENFLKPLLTHFTDENVFAVGCLDESHENGKTILRGRGIGRWEKGFLVHAAGSIDKKDTLWVSGGSGAFRKSTWDILGGLQKLYDPFYWEDIDISYRAQKAGYKIFFENESVVVHEHEKGSIKKQYSPFSVRKIAYRNQIFFTWINATDTILLVKYVLFIPYFLLRSLVNRDRAFFLGFFLACIRFPEVLGVRKRVQQMTRVKDKDVTKLYSV